MNLEVNIKFLHQLELIKEFNQQKHYQETYDTTSFVIKNENIWNNMNMIDIRINTLPWERYFLTTKRKIIFGWYAGTKRRIERIEDTGPPTENANIYAINTMTKTREKIKLNGIFFSHASRHWE